MKHCLSGGANTYAGHCFFFFLSQSGAKPGFYGRKRVGNEKRDQKDPINLSWASSQRAAWSVEPDSISNTLYSLPRSRTCSGPPSRAGPSSGRRRLAFKCWSHRSHQGGTWRSAINLLSVLTSAGLLLHLTFLIRLRPFNHQTAISLRFPFQSESLALKIPHSPI